jgi:hypothetical protein
LVGVSASLQCTSRTQQSILDPACSALARLPRRYRQFRARCTLQSTKRCMQPNSAALVPAMQRGTDAIDHDSDADPSESGPRVCVRRSGLPRSPSACVRVASRAPRRLCAPRSPAQPRPPGGAPHTRAHPRIRARRRRASYDLDAARPGAGGAQALLLLRLRVTRRCAGT